MTEEKKKKIKLVPLIRLKMEQMRVEGKKVTIAELAQELEVTKQMISRYLLGHGYPSLPKAFRLAEMLECRIEDLYKKDTEEIE